MRYLILLAMLALTAFTGWEFTINAGSVCDSTIEQEIVIGTNSECTAGFDVGWDAMRPPFPPAGMLAYFYIDDPANPDIDGLLVDYRSEGEIYLLWRIHYYTTLCGGIGDSCILSWNPDSLPEGEFKIIASMEDTGWRAPTSIDWDEATDMRTHAEFEPFWVSHMAYISYTSPLKVDEASLPADFSIRAYPNPFNSALKIAIDTPGEFKTPLRIEIYDLAGRIVDKIAVGQRLRMPPNAEEIDVTGNAIASSPSPIKEAIVWRPDEYLPSGIYFLHAYFDRLSDRGGKSVTKRLVYLR